MLYEKYKLSIEYVGWKSTFIHACFRMFGMARLSYFVAFMLSCIFFVAACGSSTSIEPTASTLVTQESDNIKSNESNSFVPTPDSNMDVITSESESDSIPTVDLVPTPTIIIPTTKVDNLGFQLSLDGEVVVEQSGLVEDEADSEEGIMFFEYSGVSALLIWLEDFGTAIASVLSDSYVSLESSQPGLVFSLLNEGDFSVDTVAGKYIAFVADSSTYENEAGGIVGSWLCESGVVFSLTVVGSDAAVVQIRFRRILDGFSCGF